MNKQLMNVTRTYNEYCPGGFLIIPESEELNNYPEEWSKILFLGNKIYKSNRTKLNFLCDKDIGVAIIGDCYDLDICSDDINFILEKINYKLQRSFEDALYYIQYLAGRYLVIISLNQELYVIPDSHCTLACYYSNEKKAIISHFQLAKDYLQLNKNVITEKVMRDPDYVAPGGKSLPALLTPFEDLYPVIANCFLQRSSNNFHHNRFYPNISLEDKFGQLNIDEKYNLFKNSIIKYLQLTYKCGNSYISLTNGGDSRCILAAAVLAGLKYDTFTYTREDRLNKDAIGASKLSCYVGYPHFLVALPKLDYSTKFYNLYRKNFSVSARFPSLAQAYYEQLPVNSNVIISTISETGTCFYKERKEKSITSSVLAKKWSFSKNNKKAEVLKLFNEYIKYTHFSEDSITDFDFYDLYYWEHRNSRWANIWYQECDLSHNVVLPFNARIINEIMLSFSIEDRLNKYLLDRLIEEAGIPAAGDYFA